MKREEEHLSAVITLSEEDFGGMPQQKLTSAENVSVSQLKNSHRSSTLLSLGQHDTQFVNVTRTSIIT